MLNALKIKNLHFTRPDGFALAIDTLELSTTEHALLCGPSGCGKSTVLNLIAGLLRSSSGEICVGGENISSARGAHQDAIRGRSIGMVFQTHNLLSGFTAKENLDIAIEFSGQTEPTSSSRAIDLLKSLGIDRVHVNIDKLSTGEQQRVAVARSLVAKPSLVLADEPTASLDPKNALETIRLLKEATTQEGSALMLSSHDPLLQNEFERIIHCEQFISETTAHE